MSVLKVNTINDASGGSNAVLYGVASPPNSMGFRNRLINSDMRIDQRNAGASVTPSSSSYTLDRWQMDIGLASKFSVQQVSDAPAGFKSSAKLTVVSAFTQASSSFMFFRQSVEGLNVSDFAWGTADAVGITVSFWVKTSVTGTYSFALGNSANNYSYIATYTIASANTWQYVSVAIPGPTAGTWLTDSSAGLRLKFDLGSSTSFNTTAGTWQAADVARTSGSVVLGATSGATWQITGVQLEAGSVASPFERRPYGTELSLCQRYAASVLVSSFRGYNVSGGNTLSAIVRNPQTMRTSPTVSITVQPSGTANITGSLGIADATPDNTAVSFTGSAAGQSYFSNCTFLATAEL